MGLKFFSCCLLVGFLVSGASWGYTGCNQMAYAPYNVTVTYTPVEPAPMEETYCTYLPYGCGVSPASCQSTPAPCCQAAPMMGSSCSMSSLTGIVCAPVTCTAPVVNGALDTTGCLFDWGLGAVASILNGATGIVCNAGAACGPFAYNGCYTAAK